MLSFIRCSLACCHQKDGYCSVNTATCVINSGDMGCIYYEPLQNDKSQCFINEKKQRDIFAEPIDKS